MADYDAKRSVENKKKKLYWRYGLSGEGYDALLTAQGGMCALCRTPGKRLCVDHEHDTGRIRALLCHGCNTLVAYVEAHWELARKAEAYIMTHYEAARTGAGS